MIRFHGIDLDTEYELAASHIRLRVSHVLPVSVLCILCILCVKLHMLKQIRTLPLFLELVP